MALVIVLTCNTYVLHICTYVYVCTDICSAYSTHPEPKDRPKEAWPGHGGKVPRPAVVCLALLPATGTPKEDVVGLGILAKYEACCKKWVHWTLSFEAEERRNRQNRALLSSLTRERPQSVESTRLLLG